MLKVEIKRGYSNKKITVSIVRRNDGSIFDDLIEKMDKAVYELNIDPDNPLSLSYATDKLGCIMDAEKCIIRSASQSVGYIYEKEKETEKEKNWEEKRKPVRRIPDVKNEKLM